MFQDDALQVIPHLVTKAHGSEVPCLNEGTDVRKIGFCGQVGCAGDAVGGVLGERGVFTTLLLLCGFIGCYGRLISTVLASVCSGFVPPEGHDRAAGIYLVSRGIELEEFHREEPAVTTVEFI